MFHPLPPAIAARMRYLEDLDAQDHGSPRSRMERLRQVPPETGRFLALQAAAAPAGNYIEIGSSAGYSGLWIALGCQAAGRTLTTFELHPPKIALARESFRVAGVDGLVTLVEGDARVNLAQTERISFCFLDTEKELYADCYELVVPRMLPGGILIADNVISHREALQSFVDHALADARLDAVVVPIGSGVLLARKV